MKCAKCSAEVPAGLRFCGLCGTQVADPTSPTVVFVAENQNPLLAQVRLVLGGEYEIERECGRGGMAAVFKALDVSLRRPVALKVMLPAAADGGAIAERLRREARRAAALDHPNIVPIYQVGEAGGIHYIVMKFVEGRPLDAIIQAQGALPLPVIVAVLRAAASALAYAHERGTVHRDIKSSNLLIDQEGRVYVSDFGLARAAEDGKMTPSGAVVGTPQFMSPEQCAGDPVGPQGDQYSLGVVAYQMLAGAAPFEASSVLAVVQHHYFTPPPDIRRVRDGIPDVLVEILQHLMAKDPARRFISTYDLVAALEALPFHEEEQRLAKETLRRLARGYRVPVVRTSALPPLPDTRLTGAGGRRTSRNTGPAGARARLLTLGIGVAAVVSASGAWVGIHTSKSREPTAPGRLHAEARVDSIPAPAVHRDSSAIVSARSTGRLSRPQTAAPTLATYKPSGRGLVRLRAEPPNAVIYIDDRKAGVGTVFDLEVPAGTRRLRISAPGSVTLDTTFLVEAASTTRLGLIALRSLP
jgi:protein kinase-like protein/PEGA domain-containing protein